MQQFTQHVLQIVFVIFFSALVSACDNSEDTKERADIPMEKTDLWWQERHDTILNDDYKDVKIVFLGDSITQGWEKSSFGLSIWQQYWGERAANLGFSGDKTQHLLWRIEHGELNNMSPEKVVLLIGTNNAKEYSGEEIADGINAVIDSVKDKLPDAKILLHRIFPRGGANDVLRKSINLASEIVSRRALEESIEYVDIYEHFLDVQGNVEPDLIPDGVHLSTKGYAIWANEIMNRL